MATYELISCLGSERSEKTHIEGNVLLSRAGSGEQIYERRVGCSKQKHDSGPIGHAVVLESL